jgi:hypothetical protein
MSPPSSGPKSKLSKKSAEAGDKLRLLFGPEDEDDMFLRINGLSPNYTALQLRIP